jgi:hypothetical protein
MALKPLQAGRDPLGQFDGYDELTTTGHVNALKGGEIVTLANYDITGTDKAAADANGSDGYVGTTTKYRPLVTRTLPDGHRPVFLADEGTTGYGQLFGEIIGTVCGINTTGTQAGPHSGAASGKVTLWDKPGLYAVTTDAVDTSADGLVYTNALLDVGEALTATSTGLLTPVSSGDSFDSANLVVARLVEFSTNGSLVNTPNYLVQSPVQVQFTQVVIHFDPEY